MDEKEDNQLVLKNGKVRWKSESKKRYARLLQASVPSCDGLFQLVASSMTLWRYLMWVFSGTRIPEERRSSYRPPTSITKLKHLQGLPTSKRKSLLKSVAFGEISLTQMADQVLVNKSISFILSVYDVINRLIFLLTFSV